MKKSSASKPRLLIAFGGNALAPANENHQHQKEEFLAARRSMEQVVELLRQGYSKIILTHGNGPQVGRIFRQQELTRDQFPRLVTLDVCVADSQGRIGYILQNVFDNTCAEKGLEHRSCSIITQVLVAADDPAFGKPTKPIGLFYTQEEAERQTREHGWVMKEDAGRGYRRVVPSPRPLEIVEKHLFRKMLDQKMVVIGAGGGGIPVIRDASGALQGVEAVIDKDHTSSLLASEMEMDTLVILTSVDYAYLSYGSPDAEPILSANSEEMEEWLAGKHFAEGSMKPKVEAALGFLKRGGKRAIIAHLNNLLPALLKRSGTQITP